MYVAHSANAANVSTVFCSGEIQKEKGCWCCVTAEVSQSIFLFPQDWGNMVHQVESMCRKKTCGRKWWGTNLAFTSHKFIPVPEQVEQPKFYHL